MKRVYFLEAQTSRGKWEIVPRVYFSEADARTAHRESGGGGEYRVVAYSEVILKRRWNHSTPPK